MTEVENKAVEYADSVEEKKHWSDEYDSNTVFTREEVEQAYLAGAKENGVVWHDLRKDPKDLPKKLLLVSQTVVNEIGSPCHYNYKNNYWENWNYIRIETPKYWTEIPQFKE